MKGAQKLPALLLILCLAGVRTEAQHPEARQIRNWPYSVPAGTIHEIDQALLDYGALLSRDRYSDSTRLLTTYLMERSRAIGYIAAEARTMMELASLYRWTGRYLPALELSLEAISLFSRHEAAHKFLASFYDISGSSYLAMGYSELAVQQFIRAAHLIEKYEESLKGLAGVYNNLGTAMTDTERAMLYFEKAYQTASKDGNSRIMILARQNQAITYERTGQPEQAEKAIREAYKLARLHDNLYMQYIICIRSAQLYIERGAYEKALDQIRLAESLQEKTKVSMTEINYGYILEGKIHMATGKTGQAESSLLNTLHLAQKQDNRHQEEVIYQNLAALYELKNDYRRALAYTKQHIAIKDSLLNEKVSLGVSNLEIQYRIHEKDKEITTQQIEIQKRNYLIAGISGGVILLSGLFFFIYRSMLHRQKVLRQSREIDQLKAAMKGEERERLRIAQELHDGIMVQFSSVKMNLDSFASRLKEPAYQEGLQPIMNQLGDATLELRRSAHNLMPYMLLSESLAGAVNYFCTSLSKSSGVYIEFQHYGDLPGIRSEYELMLYRIIQELVHNALKYAEADHIIVQIDCVDGLLAVTVEDNGKGFDTRQADQAKGAGIESIRSRVHSISGTFEIHSSENSGTTAYIECQISNLQ